MLGNHYRLTCDHPDCKAALLSAPLDFGWHATSVRRFCAIAARAGWTLIVPGNEMPARHYCPRHCDEGETLIF